MEAVTEALLISKQLSGESFVLLKIGEKGIPKTMSAKKKEKKKILVSASLSEHKI